MNTDAKLKDLLNEMNALLFRSTAQAVTEYLDNEMTLKIWKMVDLNNQLLDHLDKRSKK